VLGGVPVAFDSLECDVSGIPAECKTVLFANPLGIAFEMPSDRTWIVVEDLEMNVVRTTSTVSVVTFEGLCALALFSSKSHYDIALGGRDWGRIGSQNEDMNERFQADAILGGDVKYDRKFVYDYIGFNFKSCEMSAALALIRLNEVPESLPTETLNKLHGKREIFFSTNGYVVLVELEDKDRVIAKLGALNLEVGTFETAGWMVADGGNFPRSREQFERTLWVVRNQDKAKDQVIVAALRET
jgi:hypothetical protein